MQEADWMKSIPNNVVCNFFYAFFIVYAVIAVLTFLSAIAVSKKMGVAFGIFGLLVSLVPTTMMLFFYLICDRALLKGQY
jgi:hypothetical protein